jgi:hypothetical protein
MSGAGLAGAGRVKRRPLLLKTTMQHMKTNKLWAAAPVLLAGFLLAPRAEAVTAIAGDLILGFRASGGQGAATNLEVNLGPASNYYGAAPGAFVVTGLSTADLVSTYGSNWASRSDLSFGIVGTTGAAAVGAAPARTIWASRAEATPGTQSTPWLRGSTFTLQVPSNTIASLYTGAPGSLTNASATSNSASSALISTSLSGSWTAQEDFTPGVSFRYFNPSVLITMDDIPATPAQYDGLNGYAVLDLFEVRPGTAGSPASFVGAFGLNSSGQLVFSTSESVFAAVPEPGAALTTLGSILLLALRRRRVA